MKSPKFVYFLGKPCEGYEPDSIYLSTICQILMNRLAHSKPSQGYIRLRTLPRISLIGTDQKKKIGETPALAPGASVYGE
jgi:hypothetical protein